MWSAIWRSRACARSLTSDARSRSTRRARPQASDRSRAAGGALRSRPALCLLDSRFGRTLPSLSSFRYSHSPAWCILILWKSINSLLGLPTFSAWQSAKSNCNPSDNQNLGGKWVLTPANKKYLINRDFAF